MLYKSLPEKWIQTSDILPDIFPLDNHTVIRYYIAMEQEEMDRKATEFREWLEQLGGTSEKLPLETFRDSGTGVNTRLVVIDRLEAAEIRQGRLF